MIRKSNDGRFAFELLDPRRLLAFIAALVLLRGNGSYEHVFRYIAEGLKDPITEKFGKDVYAYIVADENKFDGYLSVRNKSEMKVKAVAKDSDDSC